MRPGQPESMRRHPTSLERIGPRRVWLLAIPLAMVVVLVTWVLAFGLTRNPDAYRNPLVGHEAPDLVLPTVDGSDSIRLDRLRGQVVVLNFWAPWCAECVTEHDDLAAAWSRYRDQGAVVLGVVYQDTARNADRFTKRMGGDWPQVIDRSSRAAIAYGVRGVPETFVIGPDGRVADWRAGAVSYAFLSRVVSRLLSKEGA